MIQVSKTVLLDCILLIMANIVGHKVFSVYGHSKHILLVLYLAHSLSSCDSLYNLSGILEHEAKIDVWKQN